MPEHLEAAPLVPQKGIPAARTGEAALHEEMRRLGRILGETLAELRGEEALLRIEQTRQAAVALRQGRLPGGRDAFQAGIASLSLPISNSSPKGSPISSTS